MKIFESARLKLTAGYLAIIMLISGFFSMIIYLGVSQIMEAGLRRAFVRQKAEELGITLPHEMPHMENLDPRLRNLYRMQLLQDLTTAKREIRNHLITINGFIFIVSAASSYYLAGRTLKPIETAMNKQKRFIADASHELRTPLTSLKTSLEVALRDKKISKRQAKTVLRSNLEDVEMLESLTNNLLELSHLDDNGKNISFEKIDISKVMKKTYKKMLPIAQKNKINMKIKTVKSIVRGNPENLEKMMLVFLDNAVKYTPKNGKITIKNYNSKKSVYIKIKDTGIGIDKKDIPFIFERFYRTDKSRNKINISGYGLGLSLANKIIDLHKGSIDVKSKPKKGTTFNIRLPLA